jgi:hypothetical protein
MIRFRIGQSWKREPKGLSDPHDAFMLEIDGVNLVPGVSDEPLVRVVLGLIDAVAQLVTDGERFGQVSLEGAGLEVCLWRRPGFAVEIAVLRAGPWPAHARPIVTVDLPALVDAAVLCARGLLRELTREPEQVAREVADLERQVGMLANTVLREWTVDPPPPWTARRSGEELGYEIRDLDGRTSSFSRHTKGGLPALLFDGDITVGPNDRIGGFPFLTMVGLVRAAGEGRVAIGGRPIAPDAVFRCGLDLCLALRTRSSALGTNPYVEALQVRCTEGLRTVQRPVLDTGSTSAPPATPPRASADAPLAARGEVRRLALSPAWIRDVVLGEEGGRLLLGKSAIAVASPHAVHAFTPRGQTAFRRMSPRGVATSSTHCICATDEHLFLFEGADESASWWRTHDGSDVGPALELIEGVLVTSVGRRGVAGLDPMTGRERWRFEPPRTQRTFLTFAGSRILVATDGGALYGLDAPTGQVRFTVRSSVPFAGPVTRNGRKAIAILRRADLSVVYACEAFTTGKGSPAGTISWTKELVLSAPAGPVISRGKVFLTGHRDGHAVVIALSSKGQLLWERSTPLDPHSQRAIAFEGAVVVTDARGHAVRLLADGELAWVLGGTGDQLASPIAPILRRHILVVSGPVLRLVDPRGGRVLASLETGPRITDVAVDSRMAIFVLKEPGRLEAWHPATALSLVDGSSRPRRPKRPGGR